MVPLTVFATVGWVRVLGPCCLGWKGLVDEAMASALMPYLNTQPEL